jgi:hypothetical protein
MNSNSDLICFICKKILNEPITLPCLCAYICNSHIDDLLKRKKTSIRCQLCDTTVEIPKNGFEICLVVQNFIKNNGHLNLNDKKYKTELENSLQKIENLYNDFKFKSREFSLFKYDQYEDLRRNIDIRRESLIEKINIISQQMISRVEASEDKSNKMISLNSIDFNFIKENEYLEEIFRNPDLNSENIKSLEIKQNKYRQDIESKLDYLDKTKIDLKGLKFESNFNFVNELFGYLDLNERFQNLITCYFNSRDIYVWDLRSNTIVKTLSGHQDGIWTITIFQNSKLISGSRDKSIRVWNLYNSECIQILRGHDDEVLCLICLKNENLASGSNDQTIKIWNLSTGELMKTLTGHSSWVYCLEQLPNENLVSGSNDATIKIWDLITGLCLRTLDSHLDWICSLKYLPTDKLISGSADNQVKIWSTVTGELLQTLYGHSALITDLELTNSNQIVSSSYDKRIKIWNLNDGNFIQTLNGHRSFVNCIKLNTDGKLYSGGEDKTIKIWNLKTNECLKTIKSPTEIWDMVLCNIFSEILSDK